MILMPEPNYSNFQERVVQAAEAVLQRDGSVGPLELMQQMRLLHPVHVEGWRKGNEHYPVLQPWIQVGPEKFQKTIRHFQEWAKQRGLRTMEAAYTRRGPGGLEQLPRRCLIVGRQGGRRRRLPRERGAGQGGDRQAQQAAA